MKSYFQWALAYNWRGSLKKLCIKRGKQEERVLVKLQCSLLNPKWCSWKSVRAKKHSFSPPEGQIYCCHSQMPMPRPSSPARCWVFRFFHPKTAVKLLFSVCILGFSWHLMKLSAINELSRRVGFDFVFVFVLGLLATFGTCWGRG